MYRSDDDGAPTLTGQYGSLINVLTAVLITGYGEKTSLGWTKEFEDVPNNKVVYRMPAGSRTFLQVDDNYTAEVGKMAQIIAYESMANVDSGIHPCPGTGETWKRAPKSYSADDTTRGWVIIGDDKGFWLFVRTHGEIDITSSVNWGLKYHECYFGDYINLNPSDPAVYCSVQSYYYNYSSLQSTAISGKSTGFWRMRGSDNERGYVGIGLGAGFYAQYGLFGNNIDLSPIGGKNVYTSTFIHAYSTTEILGSLPGLLNWIGKYTSGSDDEIREYYEYEDGEAVSFSVTAYLSAFAINVAPGTCQRLTIKLGSRFRDA